ncbi:hypothetical protein FHS88_004096 [Roseomonas alkaliterrae]|uniref:Glycosyltransferase family 1 protein n=2 Tax=Neoroseomonas alkaliterrae TaxID=1452450 RepID=A0A840XZ95_9PROT|nr:hypothetical protein [Neoroseomonas alkaliterrae]MBB5691929.1 hypothetical protein [Neoroseomonas alkaliterrae]
MSAAPLPADQAAVFAEVDAGQARLSDILQGAVAGGHMDAVLLRARNSRERLAGILARGVVTICGGVLPRAQIAAELGVARVSIISFDDWVAGRARCDLLLVNHHAFFQRAECMGALARAAAEPGFVSAIQFRDHHHLYRRNLELAALADFVFPGHPYKHEYLRAANMNILAVIPMCVGQWPDAMMVRLFRENAEANRSDALYGGYGFYPRYRARTAFIDVIGRDIPGSRVVQWRPGMEGSYLSLSQEDRFRDWLGHKVSAVVNTDFCIPNRIFDALAAGQIPLVPHGLSHLETVIPAEHQRDLPVLRYSDFDIASLRDAYARALAAYDREGAAGAARRHGYALRFHTLADRAQRMLRELRRVADQAG